MKIGLLGHGTIGIGVDHLVKTMNGMEVTKILSLVTDDEMAGREASGIDEIVGDPEIDTVVEVMGGIHPAYEFITAAMKEKKNVVTANKAVVAACYRELNALAKENGVSFRATASVGGGIPWLTALEKKRCVDEIAGLYGIMNGTTNYILSTMEESVDGIGALKAQAVTFEEALKRAQELGYAEKDPTADIDGFDVRRKVTISANVAYGVVLDEESVPTFGIRTVCLSDLQEALRKNCTVRLIAEAKREEGGIAAAVFPAFVKKDSEEGNVRANFNLFTLCGKCTGEFKFYGQGAGRYPTAGNVVSDLEDIRQRHPGFYTDEFADAKVVYDSSEAVYYVRTGKPDRFLKENTAETAANGAVFTKPLAGDVFLPWALEKRKEDPDFFAAKIFSS